MIRLRIGRKTATLRVVDWTCRDKDLLQHLQLISWPIASEHRGYLAAPEDLILGAVLRVYPDAEVIKNTPPKYVDGRVY